MWKGCSCCHWILGQNDTFWLKSQWQPLKVFHYAGPSTSGLAWVEACCRWLSAPSPPSSGPGADLEWTVGGAWSEGGLCCHHPQRAILGEGSWWSAVWSLRQLDGGLVRGVLAPKPQSGLRHLWPRAFALRAVFPVRSFVDWVPWRPRARDGRDLRLLRWCWHMGQPRAGPPDPDVRDPQCSERRDLRHGVPHPPDRRASEAMSSPDSRRFWGDCLRQFLLWCSRGWMGWGSRLVRMWRRSGGTPMASQSRWRWLWDPRLWSRMPASWLEFGSCLGRQPRNSFRVWLRQLLVSGSLHQRRGDDQRLWFLALPQRWCHRESGLCWLLGLAQWTLLRLLVQWLPHLLLKRRPFDRLASTSCFRSHWRTSSIWLRWGPLGTCCRTLWGCRASKRPPWERHPGCLWTDWVSSSMLGSVGRSSAEAWTITTRCPRLCRQPSSSEMWPVVDRQLHLGCMLVSNGLQWILEPVSRWSIGWMPPSVFMLQPMNLVKHLSSSLGSLWTSCFWWRAPRDRIRLCSVCFWWQQWVASGGSTYNVLRWWIVDPYAWNFVASRARHARREADHLTTGGCPFCSFRASACWHCWRTSTDMKPRVTPPSSYQLWS